MGRAPTKSTNRTNKRPVGSQTLSLNHRKCSSILHLKHDITIFSQWQGRNWQTLRLLEKSLCVKSLWVQQVLNLMKSDTFFFRERKVPLMHSGVAVPSPTQISPCKESITQLVWVQATNKIGQIYYHSTLLPSYDIPYNLWSLQATYINSIFLPPPLLQSSPSISNCSASLFFPLPNHQLQPFFFFKLIWEKVLIKSAEYRIHPSQAAPLGDAELASKYNQHQGNPQHFPPFSNKKAVFPKI